MSENNTNYYDQIQVFLKKLKGIIKNNSKLKPKGLLNDIEKQTETLKLKNQKIVLGFYGGNFDSLIKKRLLDLYFVKSIRCFHQMGHYLYQIQLRVFHRGFILFPCVLHKKFYFSKSKNKRTYKNNHM